MMNEDLNEHGVRDFNYFSLVRKSDGKEVYTSLEYRMENDPDMLDFEKIKSTLVYYFKRVNSAIDQQKESPRLSDEQKACLKKLELKDYVVKLKKFMPIGLCEPVFWTKEAADFLRN